MSRCTLCGGKLDSKGRCTDCGLDNAKNDKMYRLNAHNENGARLHYGECEDNLNQNRGWKDSSGTKSSKHNPGGNASKSSTGKSNKSNAGSRNDTGSKTGKGDKEKGSKTFEYEQYSSQKRSEKKVREKRARENRQAGTVKKKRGPGVKIIRLVVILYILNFVITILFGVIREHGFEGEEKWSFIEKTLSSIGEMLDDDSEDVTISYDEDVTDFDDEMSDSEENPTAPEVKNWDTQDEGYFETELTTGIYTVGYEIPAGTYQIYCPQGYAWLYWSNPEDEYDNSEVLYSLDEQEFYEEYADESCPYFEYSDLLEFKDGAQIYVSECENGIVLTGIGEGEKSLKPHDAQNLTETVTLENGMAAGMDFKQGVYDIVLTGHDAYAAVIINIEETGSQYYISLADDHSTFYRFPFAEGVTVEVEEYDDNGMVQIVPSY